MSKLLGEIDLLDAMPHAYFFVRFLFLPLEGIDQNKL